MRVRGYILAGLAGLAVLLNGCGGSGGTGETRAWKGFAEPVVYATDEGFTALTSGDMTGDGIPDLIGTLPESRAQVFPGKGNGTLDAVRSHTVGQTPRRVVVADLDENGKPDLLVVDHFDNGFRVWKNLGDGELPGNSDAYGLPNHGRFLIVGDWNRDGHRDIAAIHDGSGKPAGLWVFLGDGTGKLTKSWDYQTPYLASRDLAVGEVTGDGIPDLLIAAADERAPLIVFPGKGDGTFQEPQIFTEPGIKEGTCHLAVADLTGDGRDDVLLTAEGARLSLRRGQSAGGLSNPESLPLPAASADIKVGDLNGDGKNDIVASLGETGEVACLLSSPSSSLPTQSKRLALGGMLYWLTLADLDRDGKTDLAALDISGNRLLTLRNQGR